MEPAQLEVEILQAVHRLELGLSITDVEVEQAPRSLSAIGGEVDAQFHPVPVIIAVATAEGCGSGLTEAGLPDKEIPVIIAEDGPQLAAAAVAKGIFLQDAVAVEVVAQTEEGDVLAVEFEPDHRIV